jgi:hypothetical protein
MHLSKDLREFIALLNANSVEYLVVGAFAVAWHGYPRFTADIDILIRPTPANAERVLKTLADFGFGSLKVTREDFSKPDQILQLGVKPNRIDLITSVAGVSFDEAWTNRTPGSIDDLSVQFIGLGELLRNKESTGRPQDIADAHELRRRQRQRD